MLRVRNQALRFGALLLVLGVSGGCWVDPAPQGDEIPGDRPADAGREGTTPKPTDAGGPGKDQDKNKDQDGPTVDGGDREEEAMDAGNAKPWSFDSGVVGGIDAGAEHPAETAETSAGCGKALVRQSKSTVTIQSAGLTRKYILWLPENYDNKHPYRLVLAYHWYTGSAQQVVDCKTESIKCYTTQSPFFGLWDLANDSAIFVAPDGLDAGWANTNGRDLTFTDDIIAQLEAELCIDKTRIFANGFSYGGAMSVTLACARPRVFRAVAVYAGGIRLSDPGGACSNGTPLPVAYYGSHGTSDSGFKSGEAARDSFVKINGCTEKTADGPPSGGHTCTSYQGCSAGHPVRWCAFDEGHTPSPRDRGESTTWNPREVWTFFTQF